MNLAQRKQDLLMARPSIGLTDEYMSISLSIDYTMPGSMGFLVPSGPDWGIHSKQEIIHFPFKKQLLQRIEPFLRY